MTAITEAMWDYLLNQRDIQGQSSPNRPTIKDNSNQSKSKQNGSKISKAADESTS
jgi:hypothetical protein